MTERERSTNWAINHWLPIVQLFIFRYSRKGYLYKHFVMNAIMAEGVKPTLAELEKFEEAPEGIAIELGE